MKQIRGNIIDVVNKCSFAGEISYENGRITSIAPKEVTETQYILPGFVNAHVHIESSMLVPSEFARLAVRHGTVATVSDPHEIANVLGKQGIEFMITNGKTVPLKFHFGAPSCVPATSFETSGAVLKATDVAELLDSPDIYYLSEMMNFPGVIYNDAEVAAKLMAARNRKLPIDGHAPGLSGEALATYIHAGISTDHECTTYEEAVAKIKLGMTIQIREGSAAKNFETLYPLIDHYPDNVMLCTDDSHPDNLTEGHINLIVKRALAKGCNLYNTLRAVSYTPAKHYNLRSGLLQVGDAADFVVVNNLADLRIQQTVIDGEVVFDGVKTLFDAPTATAINHFVATPVSLNDIKVAATSTQIKVIEAIEGDLYTRAITATAKTEGNNLVSDTANDILKIVVVNRYSPTPPVVGFIKNFGLKQGAIAGSVAHDSHNIIAIGANDAEIVAAINEIIAMQGGICATHNTQKETLPLPVAGIMSNEKGETVAARYKQVEQMAKQLGCTLRAPFMTMSFMALLVIPELKIGDKFLFDGNRFSATSLYV